MSDTKVSILITAYNAESWVAQTLDSAIGQTWPNVEVILVDDGSTDGTLEIAKRYESARVKATHQLDAGACVARNRALAEAQGDFIQYLDADDLLAPDKIERQMHGLAGEPADTPTYSPGHAFTTTTWPQPRRRTRRTGGTTNPLRTGLCSRGRGVGPFRPLLGSFHVTSSNDRGSWSESLLRNQDGEYFARVLVLARKIAFVEGAWGYYRSGLAGSISKHTGEAVLRSWSRVAEMHVVFLPFPSRQALCSVTESGG